MFYQPIEISGNEGTICIDSCGTRRSVDWWYWVLDNYPDSPDDTIRPTFNYDQGPHCIVYSRECDYQCGDANNDCRVNVSDAVMIVDYIFFDGDLPNPKTSADCNCDTDLNISDAVWLINYVFAGGNEACDLDGDGVPDC